MHSLHVFPTYRLAREVPGQSSLQADGDGEQAGQWGQTWDENWRGVLLSPGKVNWTQEIIYAHSKLRSIYWSVPRYESLTSMRVCVHVCVFVFMTVSALSYSFSTDGCSSFGKKTSLYTCSVTMQVGVYRHVSWSWWASHARRKDRKYCLSQNSNLQHSNILIGFDWNDLT